MSDVFQIHLDGIVKPYVGKRLLEKFFIPLAFVHHLYRRVFQRFVNVVELIGRYIHFFHDFAKRGGGNTALHFVLADDRPDEFLQFLLGYLLHFLPPVSACYPA